MGFLFRSGVVRKNHRQKLEQTEVYPQLELKFSEDSPKIKAEAIDIGQGGMGLSCNKRIPVGREVTVRVGFSTPYQSIQFETVVGMVKWCRTQGFKFVAGIEFKDLNAHQHPKLMEFLQQNSPSRGFVHNPNAHLHQD
jgi:c-di-GMP-binding flagellar brake protein YcgR